MTAIHFANQIVADSHYGGERDNEVFFVFPSDVIASQYDFAFNGKQKDFTKRQSETKWNDIFVWPESLENPGILLDSGIVFLPESAAVDPLTGSKYASELKNIDGVEQRVMVEDGELVQKFMIYIKGIDNNSAIYKIFLAYDEDASYSHENLRTLFIDTCANELALLGFSMDAAFPLAQLLFQELILIKNVQSESDSRIHFEEEKILQLLRKSGAHWKRATDTIPSQQYWQNYFSQHTELQPKHIVYYQGSPTTAVFEFQQAHGIGRADTSKSEGNLLGFDDKHIVLKEGLLHMRSGQDPRAMKGYDELMVLGNKIVEDHYANQAGNTESLA